MNDTAGIVVAAGSGDRLPGDTPKQLVALAGTPMVAWAVRALSTVCASIVVVAPAGREDDLAAAVSGVANVVAVVAGGATRQESVRRGLEALPDGAARVLIHDAARPCVSRALLDRVVAALQTHDAVVPAVPVADTLVRDVDGTVQATLDRAHIAGVQTPQAFAVELIRRAHRVAAERGLDSSDDGSLVLALGEPVVTVSGERGNIKVTFPDDVSIAEAILNGGAR